jgi:hypothetical protein
MQEEIDREDKLVAMVAQGIIEWLKFPLLFPILLIIVGGPLYLLTGRFDSICLGMLLGYCGLSVTAILTSYRTGKMALERRLIPEEE